MRGVSNKHCLLTFFILKIDFMKLILSIDDHSVMGHVKFHQDVNRFKEVVAL